MKNNVAIKSNADEINMNNLEFLKLESPEKVSTSLVALFDNSFSIDQLKEKLSIFNKDHTIYSLLNVDKITRAEDVLEKIEQSNIKKITLLVFGKSFTRAAELILLEPSLFRRAVFVDPIFENKITFKNKVINFIEKIVPFGLPLFQKRSDSDLSNNLMRLRCPILFLNSLPNKEVLKLQFLKIPNAKWNNLKFSFYTETGSINLEAMKMILDFFAQPVKRSQKPDKVKV